MRKATVLLVDDEPNILRSLVRLLRRDGYNILSAGSGEEGLKLLAEHDIDVIISDQRMPEMTGTEFLSRAKDAYPDTVRIVLSGYTDLNSITEAINRGAIYKFLTKPWDDELLIDTVREAFVQHEIHAESLRLTEQLRQANKALSKQLAEQERKLRLYQRDRGLSRLLLQHLPVGVIGVGSDGVITVANSKVHALLGSAPDALLGRAAASVLPKSLDEMCNAATVGHVKPQYLALGELGEVKIYCASLGDDSHSVDRVLVLLPPEGLAAVDEK